METRIISSDRETILRILERETGETAREGGPPGFPVTVGGFALLRDGRLTAGEEGARVFPLLAGLGLCDWPWAPAPLPPETILCPMAGWDGGSLRNLLAILSAVGMYFGLRRYVGTEIIGWLCILVAIPFALAGFVRFQGMTAEKFVVQFSRSEILMPKYLVCHPYNLYAEVLSADSKYKEVLKVD